MRGVGLAIPSSLVVTAIVACGPQVGPGEESIGDVSDDDSDTTAPPETSSSTTRDDTTTIDPSTTTVDPSTTTVDPSTTGESTTGPIELPDCGMHSYVAECNDEDLCTWQMGVGCVIECPAITDEAQCISFEHCEWLGSCQFEGAI